MLDKKKGIKYGITISITKTKSNEIHLFIYGLFNDADSSSDYTAMNDMMLNE
jgi:hypothetical protein